MNMRNECRSAIAPSVVKGSSRHLAGFAFFTFICYLSIGLPLAVLPPYVHLKMGYSAALAGLMISIQYVATLVSRPWAGRISDSLGARISVLWGMTMCMSSGLVLILAASLYHMHFLSLGLLFLSRLLLGTGESLGSTGSTLWGITSAGPEFTAKMISYNGISTYGAMAIGAPLGVVLDQHWGFGAIGVLTAAVCALALFLASRKAPGPVSHGEPLPFVHLAGRVAPHGMALALGGIGYSVLATFITLYYASRHWQGAALCLTAFGVAFILSRILFIPSIARHGGFATGIVCLGVESVGVLILWLSASPWTALGGAALTGLGFSLVFPALGVEAVKRVEAGNRGSALGVYTAFSDVSFFLTGPIAGVVIGHWGYASVFLFALIAVVTALGITLVLRAMDSALIASETETLSNRRI